jgi:predicted Zn-dependent protease
VTRALVAAVATLAIAWLAVMERDARLQARGVAAAQPPLAPGALARAESDLRAARFLNPDRAPDVGRAAVLAARGRRVEAVALLRRVVAREPDNLSAWNFLQLLTARSDPATARRAQTELIRLDPITAPRR